MPMNTSDLTDSPGRAPEPGSPAPPQPLSLDERRRLLELARQSLVAATAGCPDPEPEAGSPTPALTEPRACFVTLTIGGELRGCIGHLTPKEPLWKAVIENARFAAIHDPRFPAVSASELARVAIEISVLTEPQPLVFSSPEDLLDKLQPGRDGVVLEGAGQRATFLPQVWDDLPDKVTFLSRLCQKGGWDTDAWRKPDLCVSLYQVEAFHDSDGC